MTAAAGLDPDTARRMLRAYEYPNAVLAASIIHDLTGAGPRPNPPCGCCDGPGTTREDVRKAWAAAFPADIEETGDKSIGVRVRHALRSLDLAGIIRRAGERIVVVDPDRLAIAAGNLRIMIDADGGWLPPNQWRELPAVPDELRETQIEAALDRANGAGRG